MDSVVVMARRAGLARPQFASADRVSSRRLRRPRAITVPLSFHLR
jgi:hypothetical protein